MGCNYCRWGKGLNNKQLLETIVDRIRIGGDFGSIGVGLAKLIHLL